MNEHEEARKIELHDARQILEHEIYLEDLNLLVTELQARIVGPQQLHVIMAAEDALGNETVVDLTYHGSFTVWWVDWSPDLEAYEEDNAEDQDDWILDDMVGEPLGIPVLPVLLDTLASDDFEPGENVPTDIFLTDPDDGFDWEVPPLSARCAKGNEEHDHPF